MPQWKRLAQALPHLRKMRQVFDSGFYLAKYPDVAGVGVDPFRHYIEHGAAEGRKPHRLFDPEYYLRTRGAKQELHELPLVDFLQSWGERCTNPHPLFDCASYLLAHPDAAERNMNPLLHYDLLHRRLPTENAGQIPFEVGRFSFMDVPLTIVFTDESLAAQAGLGPPASVNDGIVLVWEDSSGRMRFIAPPEQRPFFEIMKYDQLRAQISARK